MVSEEGDPQIRKRTRDGRLAKTCANSRTAHIAPFIEDLLARGVHSLSEIADGLNKSGFRTARGRGKWSAVQVQQVLRGVDAKLRQGPTRKNDRFA